MILDALIAAIFIAGLVAVLAIPWMGAPTYEKPDLHAHHDE